MAKVNYKALSNEQLIRLGELRMQNEYWEWKDLQSPSVRLYSNNEDGYVSYIVKSDNYADALLRINLEDGKMYLNEFLYLFSINMITDYE